MAHYDRIVYPHVEGGFYVVDDEGWSRAEWMAARHICSICDREFVNLTSRGTPVGGRKQRYCSDVCSKEGKRRFAAIAWQVRRAR